MAYITAYKYYENEGTLPTDVNWGSYQYVSLADIVNNFMLMYVGNDKLVNNVAKWTVLFHAKRAIQEINYDALKQTKIVELSVCDNLQVVLPPSYVNWVRISLYKDGGLLTLNENIDTNFAESYLQDNDCNVTFDVDGNILTGTSLMDQDRLDGVQLTKYLGPGVNNGRYGYFIDDNWIFGYNVTGRFGLNTATASGAPTFKIDKRNGVINFSSEMADQTVILEFISDGMENGDDTLVGVNKLFEDYIYAEIKYRILNGKTGVQEYVVRRAQKDRRALLSNARIRISNMKPNALLMNFRGQNQWL